MPFQFPNSPTIGQQVNNTGSGQVFTWDGTSWNSFPITASISVSSSLSLSASFAQTASYYNPRLNITKVSNNGCNGALILAEGKVYMFRGGTGGFDFYPYGGFSGSTYLDQSSGIPNTTEIIFPNESGSIIDTGTYGNNAYALFENGYLYTWGENVFGELGLGTTTPTYFPTLATTNVVQVYETINSLSEFFTYSRLFIKKDDGKVYGAGYNGQGALGLGDLTNRNRFTEITGLGTNPIGVWNINGYDGWTIAQKSNGDVVACGAGGTGNLGIGATGNYTSFQLANGWKNGFAGAIIQKVRGSANYSQGSGATYSANMNVWIKNGSNSYVMFAGRNDWGNAGNGTTTNTSTPVAATLPTNFVDFERVGPSPGQCYALLADGTVRAWGYNNGGPLGTNNQNTITTPTQVLTGASAFYLGDINVNNYNLNMASIIIKKTDNTYWRAGNNGYAQLGVGDTTNKLVFTRILLPNNFQPKLFASICRSNDPTITVAVTQENKIYAWGYNGDNTIVDSDGNGSIPVPMFIQAPALLK